MKNFIILISGFLLACSSSKEVPHVAVLYPTSDTLPENLLRMYIQFSEPMKTIGNLEKIRLVDEAGNEVRGAIFNNVYELWDEKQMQLTLIFDPARVKTGLQANERYGRALQRYKSYLLIIEDLETTDHTEVAPFKKSFYVAASDTIAPHYEKWDMAVPHAGSLSPLKLTLTETVDWMSLNHRIQLLDASENVIQGDFEIGLFEREWSFTPLCKWTPGTYSISVSARFADPCGNSLNGLFDHRSDALKYSSEDEIIEIPFSILDANTPLH